MSLTRLLQNLRALDMFDCIAALLQRTSNIHGPIVKDAVQSLRCAARNGEASLKNSSATYTVLSAKSCLARSLIRNIFKCYLRIFHVAASLRCFLFLLLVPKEREYSNKQTFLPFRTRDTSEFFNSFFPLFISSQ